MKWVLAAHVIGVIAWFAGLFYLPRLFVYHASAKDQLSLRRFEVMEWRLFWAIMTPAGLWSTAFGLWYWFRYYDFYATQNWLHVKLVSALILWGFHIACGFFMRRFAQQRPLYSATFYRFFNEVPTVLLLIIVVMVVVKPWGGQGVI